ncbi:SulP family inorganic anion transporter, partial [Klebsiella pneumoniae]|nr:SulP family inorganic anion transporter [Klebsiella pneumoniae]
RLLTVESRLSEDGATRTYAFAGQVFFASTDRFADMIDFKEPVGQVVLDVAAAHFWDMSAVGALDKVVIKLRRAGARVEVRGLNQASATLIDRFGAHDKPVNSGNSPPASH